jgi:Helicase HerA, central domain
MDPTTPDLHLGRDRSDDQPLTLRLGTLLRHLMALGSSGSGKTVLAKAVVEEAVRNGVPAICIDPQGDLCSLALMAEDPQALAAKGLDPTRAAAFAERADVVVLTPASHKGVALSADPIRLDPRHLSDEDRVHAFTATATMVVSLLGYDLGSDDGEGLVAVFDEGLHLLYRRDRLPEDLNAFSNYWLSLDEADRGLYARYLDAKKLDQACRRLARLDVGARRLLFHEGLPLDIDLLLGRDATALPGKTRVSVIYLSTLHSQEDKEYFVAALTRQLYTWMLEHPSQSPQALFYIDEVAPFIPPVRKPACKDGLGLLFRQARKYGVCCLMATQNPADVDYKAMAQFGTWALGRLTTRQDLAKVQPTVKALDPVQVESVMDQLPAQRPGEFLLLSPDNFAHTRPLRSRWLYTRHETLDEERISALADRCWRDRFAALEQRDAALEQRDAAPTDPPPAGPDEPAAPPPSPPGAQGAEADSPTEGPSTAPSDPRLLQQSAVLARAPSMSAADFAVHAQMSESRARATLKRLVTEGLASAYKEGRGHRYWALESGLRPDLGLTAPVPALLPLVNQARARQIGDGLRQRPLLGLIGEEEQLADATLEYRPLYRVAFQETIQRSLWQRLFTGAAYEHRGGSVYLHPISLALVLFHPQLGLTLRTQPQIQASEVPDFDGVAPFEARLPGEIPIDAHDWRERRPPEAVLAHFEEHYQSRPKAVEPVLLPLWRLHFHRPGRPGTRIATLDALAGATLDW